MQGGVRREVVRKINIKIKTPTLSHMRKVNTKKISQHMLTNNQNMNSTWIKIILQNVWQTFIIRMCRLIDPSMVVFYLLEMLGASLVGWHCSGLGLQLSFVECPLCARYVTLSLASQLVKSKSFSMKFLSFYVYHNLKILREKDIWISFLFIYSFRDFFILQTFESHWIILYIEKCASWK